jgi:CIC family chloride channel protein
LQRSQLRRRWYRIELRATHFFDRVGLPENQKIFLLTVLVGAVCGVVAVSFHTLAKALERNIIRHAFKATGWEQVVLTLLIPTLGGAVVGVLLQYWVPEARGSGIPGVRAAYLLNYGRIPLKVALGKMVTAAISLGTGASIGREGPTVQICASVASFLGRFFAVSRRRLMELLPVGSAAGVAAAFNTPMSAVTFAFEEIVGDLNQRMLGGVLIAAVIASAISRGMEGPGPIYAEVPAYGLNNPAELVFYVLLGAIVGCAGVFFSRTLLRLRTIFRNLHSVPGWIKPAIGGLGVGIVGLFAQQAMGSGYDTLSSALKGNLPLTVMLTLSLAKLVTTALSYGSGGAGGIFAPSLFIGAMVGGTLGELVKWVFPNSPTAVGAFSLVGMGASFCATIRAPITSVLIIFEMTSNYSLILPLMIANAVAYIIASRLQPVPIYDALLQQDGINLMHTQPVAALHKVTTASVMTREVATMPLELSVREALDFAEESRHHGFPVVDDGQRMVGFVTTNDLKRCIADGKEDAPLVDVAIKNIVHAHPDHTLDRVMVKLGQEELSLLPVVSRVDTTRLLGIISMRDVLRAQARLSESAD